MHSLVISKYEFRLGHASQRMNTHLALYRYIGPITGNTDSTMDTKKTMSVDTGIAIIGMGCRLPGNAKSLENFWELLIHGRNGWSEVPPERWNATAYYHPSGERKGTVS